MSRKLKILVASSEVYPYAKTGGLADVSAALPKALHALGHDVRIIMPKYKITATSGKMRPLGNEVKVPVGSNHPRAFLFEDRLHDSIPVYFAGNESYYFRNELYGENDRDYPDNAERFIFFCRSILEICKSLPFQPDIIHCNDWQTGLVPAYLKSVYATDPWFQNTRTVFSIHNLGYQGNFDKSTLALSNLPKEWFHPEGYEFYGQFSFLKSGLVFSDLLTTVSPTYSKEIQTKSGGFHMDGVLRSRTGDLYGVLNGVDEQTWDPASDIWIKSNYSAKNLSGKNDCRLDLAERFSLELKRNTPVIGMVTRLSEQKGIDLVAELAEDLIAEGVCFVLLGSGDPRYEEFFFKVSRSFPDQCGAYLGYDEPLAHKIIAGSDILLMPSHYEPCGLTQMYALKYGTVPVVRSVGGLQDTVRQFSPTKGRGNGFKFKPYSIDYLLKAIQRALSVYRKRSTWRRLMLNGMKENNGWTRAAEKYSELYIKALKRKH